jgi:hypothetical protein
MGEAFDRENRRKRVRDYDDDMQYRWHGQIFNGSTKFVNRMLSLNAALLLLAISGGIGFAFDMKGRVSAMEAKIEALGQTISLIVNGRIK